VTVAAAVPEKQGHPPGLWVLFFSELWERFCYYGMRALLALYVADLFFVKQKEASLVYGAYTALIYATGIFGGAIADRLLGFRRSIVLGGLVMAGGCFLLVVRDKDMFLLGLSMLIVGNGLFKPNISSLVGKLYQPGDPRRDSGFTLFYMGINMGALLAPLVCQAVSAAFPKRVPFDQLWPGLESNPDYATWKAQGFADMPDYRDPAWSRYAAPGSRQARRTGVAAEGARGLRYAVAGGARLCRVDAARVPVDRQQGRRWLHPVGARPRRDWLPAPVRHAMSGQGRPGRCPTDLGADRTVVRQHGILVGVRAGRQFVELLRA
jgi:hypothetical protein